MMLARETDMSRQQVDDRAKMLRQRGMSEADAMRKSLSGGMPAVQPEPTIPEQVTDLPKAPVNTTMPVEGARPIVQADPGMLPGSDRKVLDPTEGTVTPLPRVIDDSAQRLQLQEILRQLALRQPLPQGLSQRMIA